MDFVEKHYLLIRIAKIISQEKTGSLEEFAQRFDIKKDMLFDCIAILRQLTKESKAEILYDRDRKTYYFSPHGKFTHFKFIIDVDNQIVTD